MNALAELTLQFLVLSLMSVGGANATLPEIQRRVVEVEHWMTSAEFTQLFALSQAAPGPNVLVVSLVGWKVAGVVGGFVAMIAMCAPSSVLAYAIAHASDRFRHSPWRIAIQRAIVPVTVGLIAASGFVIASTTDHDAAAFVLTIATLVVTVTTRIHPLWMLAVGAVVGVFAFA